MGQRPVKGPVIRLLRQLWLFLALVHAGPALALPALWQVTSSNGGRVTLLGTVHVLPTRVLIGEAPPDPEWFSPRARAAFDAAQALVVELVPNQHPAGDAATYRRLAFLPKPVPVAARLPARLRPKLALLAEQGNLSLAALARLQSWAVAIALVQSQINLAGLDPGSGADVTLVGKALAANKPVIALETAEQQLRLFAGLSAAEQRLVLETTVQEAAQSAVLIDALVAAWLAGNGEDLAKGFSQGGLSSAAERRLLRDRNRNWVEQIEKLLPPRGQLFMAVGAAHLLGPDNILKMLEARGYTVERVE